VATVVETLQKAFRGDCNFFAENYVYTEDPQASSPVRKWPHYPHLQAFLQAIAGAPGIPRRKIVGVKKSRHLLFTWALCVFLVQLCAFTPHKQGMIQSQKEEKAKALINFRIRFILREIARRFPWLLPSVPHLTSQSVVFTFPDGSRSSIWSVPQGPDQVASYSPSVVVVDEAALQEHFKMTYYTSLPAVSSGGQFVAVSSVRPDAWFNRFCSNIEGAHIMRVHYSEHPEYIKEAKAMGGWDAWKKLKLKEWDIEDERFWDQEMEIKDDIPAGLPAFKPPFRVEHHVSPVHIVADPTRPVERGWDFGFRHPALVWTQRAVNGQWLILREYLAENVLLAQFVREGVRMSKEIAPGATFEDYCDPSGVNRRDAGISSVQVLNEHGIYPRNLRRKAQKVPLVESVKLIRRNLSLVKINGQVRPGTLIDPRCRILIKAFDGTYATSEKHPDKFVGGKTVHLIDAVRYIAASVFRLGAVPKKPQPKPLLDPLGGAIVADRGVVAWT